MGNSSVYSLSKYPTKWSFQNPFSNSETLFLWYSFMRIANGKDKFSFSSFLKICMTYRPNRTNITNYELVAKSLFRVMDIDSDDIIRFEDYLQTCFILTRGSVEAKLEIMFYILKDQIGTKITKINLKKKLENLTLFVCPVRAKELNIKFCEGDISREHKILESIFLDDEKQISEQIFIQRFFKKVNEALHMICILELLLLPLAFGIEKKMKNKIYKLPLLYINAYELQRQSYSQYIINKKKRKPMDEPTAKKILIKPKPIQEEEEDEESNEKDSIDEMINPDPTDTSSSKKTSKGKSWDDIKQEIDPEKVNVTNQRRSVLVQPSFNLQDSSTNNRIPTTNQLASTAMRSSRIIYSKSEEQIHDTFMSSMPNICTCGSFLCDCENKKRPKLERSERQPMLARSLLTRNDKHSPLERSFKSEFDKKVPLGIYMLCRELTKKVKSTPYTASKFEEIIWTKPNKANIQAIQSAFELNLAPAIITDDFTLAELLHSLKTVLLEMPSPLLTWSLSINALSIKLEKTKEHEKRAFLKNLLESIPSSHLSTINCLIECFSNISNGDKKIQSLLASFFGNCFVRFADPEDRLAYTPFDSVNFKASIETTPKDFVYFLLEEKSLFASFSYDEMSDFIDETVRTPLLQSLVTSQRLTLSYSDQYLSPLTNKPHSGSKNKTSNPSSSYSTESYYVSSNALSSSQRSDSRNSMDLEEINFNKKSTHNVFLG